MVATTPDFMLKKYPYGIGSSQPEAQNEDARGSHFHLPFDELIISLRYQTKVTK